MLRRSGITIAYLLAGLLLLAGMLVVHLPTSLGRRAVRDVANAVLKHVAEPMPTIDLDAIRRAPLAARRPIAPPRPGER